MYARRLQSGVQHADVLADHDGTLSPGEVRIALDNLIVKCPNSRCCYRTCASCVDPAMELSSLSEKEAGVSFSDFRRTFLLLPQDRFQVQYWLRAGDPSCCDVRLPVALPDTAPKPHASPWGHLFAGACAGAAARTATAPLETLRLLAMSSAESAGAGAAGGGILAAGLALARAQGWRALYRGNLLNVARAAPQRALDYFTFDLFKAKLAPARAVATGASVRPAAVAPPEGNRPLPGAAATFAAAGAAGTCSTLILYPLDVIRFRLSTDTTGTYRTIGHAARTIVRLGGPTALYRCAEHAARMSCQWQCHGHVGS